MYDHILGDFTSLNQDFYNNSAFYKEEHDTYSESRMINM